MLGFGLCMAPCYPLPAMSLRAHLRPLDLRAVLGHLAGLVRLMGWLLLPPTVLAWFLRELMVAASFTAVSAAAHGD